MKRIIIYWEYFVPNISQKICRLTSFSGVNEEISRNKRLKFWTSISTVTFPIHTRQKKQKKSSLENAE